jgi:hypothetical protein
MTHGVSRWRAFNHRQVTYNVIGEKTTAREIIREVRAYHFRRTLGASPCACNNLCLFSFSVVCCVCACARDVCVGLQHVREPTITLQQQEQARTLAAMGYEPARQAAAPQRCQVMQPRSPETVSVSDYSGYSVMRQEQGQPVQEGSLVVSPEIIKSLSQLALEDPTMQEKRQQQVL